MNLNKLIGIISLALSVLFLNACGKGQGDPRVTAEAYINAANGNQVDNAKEYSTIAWSESDAANDCSAFQDQKLSFQYIEQRIQGDQAEVSFKIHSDNPQTASNWNQENITLELTRIDNKWLVSKTSEENAPETSSNVGDNASSPADQATRADLHQQAINDENAADKAATGFQPGDMITLAANTKYYTIDGDNTITVTVPAGGMTVRIDPGYNGVIAAQSGHPQLNCHQVDANGNPVGNVIGVFPNAPGNSVTVNK